MSTNNNDKDFPTINIDIDDRRPQTSSRKPTPGPGPTDVSKSGSSSGLAFFALLIALCSTGGSAYLFLELEKAKSLAVKAEQRIVTLEDKLSATGEQMGNSTVALQVKVNELTNKSNELWDQMDKLWASAWRRNQEEIKTLGRQITSVRSDTQKLLKDIDEKVKQTESSSQQLISRIDGLNGKLTTQANDILTASVSAEQAAEFSRQQSDKIDDLNDKILLLEKRNTSLLTKLSDIEVQVRELATKTVSNRQLGNTDNNSAQATSE